MVSAPMAGQGLTSARIRRYHHRIVLQRLRRLGEASKADLARAADLTNTAIGQIVDELQALGLIAVVGKRHEGQRGQPATMLRLEPAGAYGIGVRLDRSRIETALVDLGGRVILSRAHDGPLPPPERALRLVAADIAAFLATADEDVPARVAGIGLARPFNLGAWHDKLDLTASGLAVWDGVDFAGMLAGATGLAVHEENDGTAAAIGELFHGHGREIGDFLYLFIGPAIGGGVILDGDYRRGPSGNAGDVAVIPVAPSRLDSAPPARGNRDILLSRASIAALIRHLRSRGVAVTGLDDLAGAIETAPEAVDEWLEDCVAALVDPILAATAFLDVPAIVIDGDLGRPLLGRLAGALTIALAAALPEAREAPAIVIGSFGSNAGSLGAASLPLFIHFAPRPTVLTGTPRLFRLRGTEDARAAS